MQLHPSHSAPFRSLTQLRRDTQLLNSLNIMDYSLLLGIHYRDRPIPAELQEDMSAEEMEQLGTRARDSGEESNIA